MRKNYLSKVRTGRPGILVNPQCDGSTLDQGNLCNRNCPSLNSEWFSEIHLNGRKNSQQLKKSVPSEAFRHFCSVGRRKHLKPEGWTDFRNCGRWFHLFIVFGLLVHRDFSMRSYQPDLYYCCISAPLVYINYLITRNISRRTIKFYI